MTDISIPASFEEVSTEKSFGIKDDKLALNIPEGSLEDLFHGLLDELHSCEDFLDIDERTNDTIFSTINNLASVGDHNKSLFMQFMINLVQRAVSTINENASMKMKTDAKKILYCYQHLCIKAEKLHATSSSSTLGTIKSKSKSSKYSKFTSAQYSWLEWRVPCLSELLKISSAPLNKLWSMGIIQENFLSALWSYPLKLLVDRPAGVAGVSHKEIETRALCVKVIARITAHFSSPESSGSFSSLSAAVLDALVRTEHMCGVTVEICHHSHGGFVTAAVLGEIGRMDMNALSATGLKNVAGFLESFAKSCPMDLSKHFPMLVTQLDSPAHQIRSAILQAMGHIVSHVHSAIQSSVAGVPQDYQDAERGESSSEGEFESDGDDGSGSDEERGEEKKERRTRKKRETGDYQGIGGFDDFNARQKTRFRDSVLDMIVERTHDTSPYTRSTVLKVWTALLEGGSVPVARVLSVGEIAVDRLHDKNAAVRRNALVLLTSTVDCNPLSPDLGAQRFIAQKAVMEAGYKERVQQLRCQSVEILSVEVAAGCSLDADESSLERRQAEQEEFELSAEVVSDSVVGDLREKRNYVNLTLAFISLVGSALPKVQEMLKSKTSGDVTEALRFVASAINFNVEGAMRCFQSAFSLVWHEDATIRAELLNTFRLVCLSDGAGEDSHKLSSGEVADNLIRLVRQCDDSQSISLEKIVSEMFAGGELDQAVVDAIWTRVELLSNPTTVVPSATNANGVSELGAALNVVSMICSCASGVLTNGKIATVIRAAGLDQTRRSNDLSAQKAGIQCLQTLPSCYSLSEAKGSLKVADPLLPALPAIVLVLGGGLCRNDEESTRLWFSMCEEAAHTLFHVCPYADRLAERVIQHMYASLSKGSVAHASAFELSRFLYVLGQTALSALVLAELIAACAKKHPVMSSGGVSGDGSAAEDSLSGGGAVDAMEEEMGTAAAADADHERLLGHVTEQELVVHNILGKFLPLLCYIVADDNKQFSHPVVREASVLALCRYMSISSAVCGSCLPLLFTVLEKEASVAVRTTIVIALGDLAFRFPNAIEPWTDRMYSKLRDPSVVVRYNTLMVITHLVLNDMIKVKGQVSHVALSLNDENETVCDLAKLFFLKLAERSNNPVYNLLGDIISIFSKDSSNNALDASRSEETQGTNISHQPTAVIDASSLTVAQFRSTMHFLLSFVQKDKQADMLLERLLVRMGTTSGLTQRRNLAFCVSELSVTEKGVKRMIELVKNIKDALYDAEVLEAFRVTASRAKKTVRGGAAETKSSIEEFEQLLEAIHSRANGEESLLDGEELHVGIRDEDAETQTSQENTKGNKGKSARKGAATKSKAKRAPRRRGADSDEEESDEDSAGEDIAPAQKTIDRPKGRAGRGAKTVIDSDDE